MLRFLNANIRNFLSAIGVVDNLNNDPFFFDGEYARRHRRKNQNIHPNIRSDR